MAEAVTIQAPKVNHYLYIHQLLFAIKELKPSGNSQLTPTLMLASISHFCYYYLYYSKQVHLSWKLTGANIAKMRWCNVKLRVDVWSSFYFHREVWFVCFPISLESIQNICEQQSHTLPAMHFPLGFHSHLSSLSLPFWKQQHQQTLKSQKPAKQYGNNTTLLSYHP